MTKELDAIKQSQDALAHKLTVAMEEMEEDIQHKQIKRRLCSAPLSLFIRSLPTSFASKYQFIKLSGLVDNHGLSELSTELQLYFHIVMNTTMLLSNSF